MAQNIFDTAAWYLLSYTNTLSFLEWRDTVKQAYLDLEGKYGPKTAKDTLMKMVAYYCMEKSPGAAGRKASHHFRMVHKWQDFRDDDLWWLDEWKSRRAFDLKVDQARAISASVPSIPPENVHDDHWGREALSVVLSEARRRIEWNKRSSLDNLNDIEQFARDSISIWGGWVVCDLGRREVINDWQRLPSLQTMYFLDRIIVEDYGDNLKKLKEKEYE